ncbi:hypothetical protein DDB_G0289931 [Dictyostelium discoideum AX4]|uniref:Flavin-containing monooxygenase n=1 Tax=Dictyostelium discoideum TaxID=44689 RepID=Q54GT0_DICDI|nr:hypothetical protein DDB_G0289931 [Dictyostelium discoideum AX4]EAL62478.1 hypothetical protein DDB_G0289931 [Dictyostelium discoideum AX4]|eukprot:XP_635989.1 hypothetical protein DDB_G0289931 [Dictyostelium discoideum AX4]
MINNNNKTVAIIGFGPAGICSTKSSIENGLIPTVFEMSSELGGVWNPSIGKCWDNLTTNVSRYVMCFSDFDYHNDDYDIFPNYKTVYQYLINYVNHFQLKKYVEFNSKVIKVERIDSDSNTIVTTTSEEKEEKDKIIKITWINSNDNKTYSKIFDYLIVATGLFSKPQNSTMYENELKQFTGKIIHSQDYKNNEIYKEKNVLVLGSSTSACEISAEISMVTKKCIIVGHENSYIYSKLLPNENGSKLVPLDSLLFQRSKSYEQQSLPKDEFSKLKKQMNLKYCPNQSKEINPTSKIIVNTPTDKTLGFVASSSYIEQVENGFISVHCGNEFTIKSSSKKSIKISNCLGETHTEDNIDFVILCNGYQPDLSFFDETILNSIDYLPSDSKRPLCLYKNIFAPNSKNIAFISFFRSLFVAEVELMSRMITMIFSSKIPYPTEFEIKNGFINRGNNNINNNNDPPYFLVAGSTVLCDQIAKEIGVLPDFKKLKQSDPKLYDQLWNGYFTPATYRLVGNGSNPKVAKEMIEKVNKIYDKLCN